MKLSSLIALACLVAPPLWAQDAPLEEDAGLAPPRALDPPPRRDPHEALPQRENEIPLDFSAADLDGDGYLSIAEATVIFPKSVVVVDLDEDGMLSRAEVRETMPGIRFEADGSEDAPIGESEYAAMLEAIAEMVREEEGTEQRVG